jgi:hypothetical protein
VVEVEAMSVRPNPTLAECGQAMTRARLLAAAVATAEACTRVQGKVLLLTPDVGRHKDLAYMGIHKRPCGSISLGSARWSGQVRMRRRSSVVVPACVHVDTMWISATPKES